MGQLAEKFSNWIDSGFDFNKFIELRELVLQSPEYDFYKDTTAQIMEWLDLDENEKVINEIQNIGVNEILCPDFHKYIAIAYKRQGNMRGFDAEITFYSQCVIGIMETGDGTLEKPYKVLRISDEYAVMRILKKEFVRQSLISDGDKSYDLIEFSDGSELYFDITASKIK